MVLVITVYPPQYCTISTFELGIHLAASETSVVKRIPVSSVTRVLKYTPKKKILSLLIRKKKNVVAMVFEIMFPIMVFIWKWY